MVSCSLFPELMFITALEKNSKNVGVYVFDPQIRGYFLALSVFWIVCSIILNDWSGSPKRTNPSKKCIFRENFVFDSFCPFLVSSWCFHTSWSKRPIFLSQFFGGIGAVLQKICEVWNLPYWYCRVSTVHLNILILEESKVKFQRFFAALANPIKGHDFAKNPGNSVLGWIRWRQEGGYGGEKKSTMPRIELPWR